MKIYMERVGLGRGGSIPLLHYWTCTFASLDSKYFFQQSVCVSPPPQSPLALCFLTIMSIITANIFSTLHIHKHLESEREREYGGGV